MRGDWEEEDEKREKLFSCVEPFFWNNLNLMPRCAVNILGDSIFDLLPHVIAAFAVVLQYDFSRRCYAGGGKKADFTERN